MMRHFLFFATILSTASIVLAAPAPIALPLPDPEADGWWNFPTQATLTLPPQAAGLPKPNNTLKYILLGIGTQNYTCATSDWTSTPVAIGAVASLFNVGPFLARYTQFVPSIASLALNYQQRSGLGLCQVLQLPSFGKHYFDTPPGAAQRNPTFDLSRASPAAKLVAKKVAGIPAPADAFAGLSSEGAVDWLYLTQLPGAGSYGGVTDVYRVNTAGGKAPATCAGLAGQIQVEYTTQYWFYGP